MRLIVEVGQVRRLNVKLFFLFLFSFLFSFFLSFFIFPFFRFIFFSLFFFFFFFFSFFSFFFSACFRDMQMLLSSSISPGRSPSHPTILYGREILILSLAFPTMCRLGCVKGLEYLGFRSELRGKTTPRTGVDLC